MDKQNTNPENRKTNQINLLRNDSFIKIQEYFGTLTK